MSRTDVILRRLGIIKQHVIDYCKEKHPHTFSRFTYFHACLHSNIRVTPIKELESFKIE